MTSIDPMAAYTMYAAAWNETDDLDARRDQLARSWAPTATLFDPETPDGLVGADALDDYISATHAEMPGLVISETSEPEFLGNRLRVRWEARQDGTQVYTGTDFVEFAEDGHVSRV